MQISDLVDLPNIKVTNVVRDNHGNLLITVVTTESSSPCHVCGKQITKRHGCDREIKLRHLPVFGNPAYIIYKPHRYICEDCDNHPTTTATPDWHKAGSHFTIDYENYLLVELINSTVVDASKKNGITEASLMGVIDRHIDSKINWNTIHYIDMIGVDEISLKKGHQQYVTIITSRHKGKIRLLAILDGRKKAIVKAFFKSIPAKLKKSVTAICTDMNNGYINAAKEVFKKQTIVVVDRFHVAKQYRGELDKYRQKILKQLKQKLPAHEYEKLKGTMHMSRRSNECLTKDEKEKLNHLFSHSQDLAEAYRLAIKLTQIFNTHMSRDEALIKIREWIMEVKRFKLTCFNKFLKTLNQYRHEIANYFIGRNNSGFVEGLNNKVKVLKRRCYGIFNLKHFFQRLHLDVSGYELFIRRSAC